MAAASNDPGRSAPDGADSPAPGGGAGGGAAAAPRRPNLLFIWADQHRADTLPHAGNAVIKAPHLDALSRRSFVFRNAYCCQPVCTPSRGTIMTGLQPHHHGAVFCDVHLRDDTRTIAEYLPADYLTAYFGKWHLGNELDAQHGFREWITIEDVIERDHFSNPEDLKKRSSYFQFLVRNGFPPDVTDPLDQARLFSFGRAAIMDQRFTKSAFLAGEAERFLRERRDGRPFMLSVSMLEPHPPTFGPWNDRYDPETVPTGPAFGKPIGPDASRLHRRIAERFRTYGYDDHPIDSLPDLRRIRANYYGLVSMVDHSVGRILRALEDSGQADHTIVVYTSDHGDMMGDHAIMGKLVFYEQSVRIPLIIHVPWLSRDRVMLDGPLSQVDLMSTLLDLMGAGAPGGVDGQSRAGALRDPSTWRPENIVVEWYDYSDRGCDGRSVVSVDGWKLNLYRDDRPELYDLNTDTESRNVAREPGNRDRIRRMSEWLRDWQGRHGDPMTLTV
jgi:arylsulfatase A-like enzyme